MASSTSEPDVVRVSQKGQATIPKPLREKFGIETPGEVFVYEDNNRIVVEPVPSLEDLQGIHASDDREPGAVTERVREHKREELQREAERATRHDPTSESE
jgi:looped-hinge helix DNA binding domain, AbrB family